MSHTQTNKRTRKNPLIEEEKVKSEFDWDAKRHEAMSEYESLGRAQMATKSDLELQDAFKKCESEKKIIDNVLTIARKPERKTKEDYILLFRTFLENDDKGHNTKTVEDHLRRLEADENIMELLEEQMGLTGYLKNKVNDCLYNSAAYFNGAIANYRERTKSVVPVETKINSKLGRF